MTRSKTKTEVEHLRGENRALRAENVRLKRQLRIQEKHPNREAEPEAEPEVELDLCGNCGKGKFSIMDLGKFIYLTCPVCGHREKV